MIFRLARHTNRIEQLTDFYVTIVGLEILGKSLIKRQSGDSSFQT